VTRSSSRRSGPARSLVSLVALTAVAAGFAAAAALAGAPAVRVLPPAHGVYQAAFPGFCGTEDCVSAQRIRAFERLAGKRIVWTYF